jgi:EmrB/QacA subfamily drug resistance transporter
MTLDYKQTKEYRRRWWTLLAIAVSVLIIVLDTTIVNIALPTLQRELDATMSQLQWISNAYILAFGALMLTMGALGDRIGRKRMLQLGIILFALGSLVASFSHSAGQLIGYRAIMGFAGAMIAPATLAIITNVFPREERGRAIGIWAGLNSIGIALGPIIGGLIIDNIGWKWIFLVNLPVAAVALIAGWFLIPESRDPHSRPIDVLGTILSAAGLGALVFGLIQGDRWGWTDPGILASLVGAAVLLGCFIFWENRTKYPMLDVSFFRHARFSAGVGAVSIMALAMMGVSFGLTLYMQFVRDYTALQTGVRLIPLALGIFIGAGMADRVVSRFGTTLVIFLGFLGTAVMAVVTSFWEVETAYWIIGLVLFGIAFFLGNIAAPAADAVMGALPEERAGIGSAMNSASRIVSGSLGIAVLGTALSSIYTSSFEKAASAFPGINPEIMKAASDSVGAAVTIADKLPAGAGDAFAMAASTSFMDGWQVMCYVTCGLCVIGAFVILKYMPSRHQ